MSFLEKFRIAKGDYIYDPQHKKHPSGGYHKTEKGWSKFVDKSNGESNGQSGKEIAQDEQRKTEQWFGAIQKRSNGMSAWERESYHRNDKQIDDETRTVLQTVFGRKLRAGDSRYRYAHESLVNPKTKKQVNLYRGVDADTFHSIFSTCHNYLPMGDCVDVHNKEDYEDTENYMTDDGMSGFSITKDGDLISVFSLSKQGGFLGTIAPIVKKKAKTLDCFELDKENNLPKLYEKAFGFQTASILDFNEQVLREDKGDDYTDKFLKNYGKPPVHFMVNTSKKVTPKHFGKNDWSDAYSYQQSMKQGVTHQEIKANKLASKVAKMSFLTNKIYFISNKLLI